MIGTEISRRAMLVKLGLLLNGVVAAILAVPIVRYLLSPALLERKPGYESWLSLGGLNQFPAGQTRLATYRNPVVNPWDGETADIACWVRNLDGQNFQVFAVNCAHLDVRFVGSSVEPIHVPMPRRGLLSGRLSSLWASGTRTVSVPL